MTLNRARGRRKRLISAVAVLCAGLVSLAGPAQASSPEGEAAPPETGDHAMGSQIRKHEGGGGPVVMPKDAPLATVNGMDVSGHQGNVDWKYWWDEGMRFAFVKATEGTGYKNPYFAQQYNGSYDVGMIRGAYHFALPDRSTGAEQAKFFAANGGGWSADGRTLPGVLDIEHNPYGEQCYGLNPQQMTGWIEDFSHTYHRITGRYPVIYTTTQWWNTCTGGADVAERNPLWVARYNDFVGELPGRWQQHTFWQYSDSGRFPGCQDVFNGSYEQLKRFAAA